MDSDTKRQVASPQLSIKIQTHLWVFVALIQIHVLNDIWETLHVSKQKCEFAVGSASVTQWKLQMPKIKSKSFEIFCLDAKSKLLAGRLFLISTSKGSI